MRIGGAIRERLLGSMDRKQMPLQFRKLAMMQLFHVAATVLQGLYLSTLIVRVTGDTGMTLIYNLVFYNVATVGHLLGAVLVRRLPAIYCTRLCSVLYLGMYATLLFGMDQLGMLWPLVATFCGLAAAFNYIAYMILLLDCTEDETRDRSLSYMSLQSGVLSLLLPMIGGALITFINNLAGNQLTGYFVLYSICSVFLVCMVVCSFRLPPRKPEERKIYFREVLRDLKKNRDCQRMMAMDAITGFRDGTFSFFVSVLFFQLVDSEFLTGLQNFGTGALAILAAFLAGRWMRPDRRIPSMAAGVTLMMIPALLMFFSFSPFTILALSLCSGLMTSFVYNPATSIALLVMSRMPDGTKKNPEYIGVRLFFVGAGRTLGNLMILCFPSSTIGYVTALVIIIASQYLLVYWGKKIVENLHPVQSHEEEPLC